MAARGRAVPADPRRRRAARLRLAAERRQRRTRTCRQARRSASSARRACTSARAFPGTVPPWADVYDGLDAFNTVGERPVEQLGHAGRRRRQVHERRHPGDPHPRHGAAFASQLRPARRPHSSTATPTNACASSARFRCASSTRQNQPILDPDGNPDTSFLAKIPADSPFTFQTLDQQRHGAEHGPDLAPGAAGRDARTTAAAATRTARSRSRSRRPRRRSRRTASTISPK